MDVLEHDSRPTFTVLMEYGGSQGSTGLVPAYWNPAMATATANYESLLEVLLDTSIADASAKTVLHAEVQDFRSWISAFESSNYFVWASFTWTKTEIAERNVMIVSGIPSHASSTTRSRKSFTARTQCFDWTNAVPPSNMSPHVAWARSIDWGHTSVGPMSLWPLQLRSFANLVLSDPRP